MSEEAFSDDDNNYARLSLLPRETDSEEHAPSGRNVNIENNRDDIIIKIDYKCFSRVIQLKLPVPEEAASDATETDVEDNNVSDREEERNLATRRAEGVSSSQNSEDSDSDTTETLETEENSSSKRDSLTEEIWPPNIVSGCIVEYVKRIFAIPFPVFENSATDIVQAMRDEYIRRSFYKDPGLFFTDEHVANAIDREYGSGRAKSFIQNLRRYSMPLLELLGYERSDVFNFGTISLLKDDEICEKAMMYFPFIVREKNFIPILEDNDNRKVENSDEGAFTMSFPGGKIRKNGSIFILAHDAESTVLSLYGAYLLLGISYPNNSKKTFAIMDKLFFERDTPHLDIADEVKRIIKYCQFKRKS